VVAGDAADAEAAAGVAVVAVDGISDWPTLSLASSLFAPFFFAVLILFLFYQIVRFPFVLLLHQFFFASVPTDFFLKYSSNLSGMGVR